MHSLRQKLNLVTVPVFYLPFPAAVLVYVRVLLSKYSFSQISVLFSRAGLEWAADWWLRCVCCQWVWGKQEWEAAEVIKEKTKQKEMLLHFTEHKECFPSAAVALNSDSTNWELWCVRAKREIIHGIRKAWKCLGHEDLINSWIDKLGIDVKWELTVCLIDTGSHKLEKL